MIASGIGRRKSPAFLPCSSLRLAMRTVALCATCCLSQAAPPTAAPMSSYEATIAADEPVLYWNWNAAGPPSPSGLSIAPAPFETRSHGKTVLGVAGPRPRLFPLFNAQNNAIAFGESGAYLIVPDTATSSALDFDNGDSITIEAWVNPNSVTGAAFHHILQKGRTGNPGVPKDNQNYALRLKSPTGQLSFLFRSRGPRSDWHRWTSQSAVGAGDGWHHVVVTYTFGDAKSIRAYIDGAATNGNWDMGGATTNAPVVDNDELWIGNMLDGALDSVAIYRKVLSPERVRAHYRYQAPDIAKLIAERLPVGRVLVDICDGVPDSKSWRLRYREPDETIFIDKLAIPELPHRYNSRAVRVDRKQPFLVRAAARIQFPVGPHRLVVRAHDGARLIVDGNVVATTPFFAISSSAHGKVTPLDRSLGDAVRPLRRGHQQDVWEFTGDGESHVVVLETIVGRGGRRPETEETWIAIGPPTGPLAIVGFGDHVAVTDDGWSEYRARFREWRIAEDAIRRQNVGVAESVYWQQRHQFARRQWQDRHPPVPAPTAGFPANNAVDHFINTRLAAAGRKPGPLADDNSFLRRTTLDVWGVVPTPKQLAHFANLNAKNRRAAWIEELLADERWADHWVGYWQDVLAENPNIIKPTLNNSGPFRWWIYESFFDNKPFDRFITELVMMEGSHYFGGPGGFELATQNDAPMAAKARIVAQASLGIELKCSRCHDDPYREYNQRDLFELAAMLKRSPQGVPETSSIPGGPGVAKSLIVDVTLPPGEQVKPRFPFEDLLGAGLPTQFLHGDSDTREQLALWITSPANKRFPQVIVNRLWRFYMGRGLIEPVDDWEDPEPSHPKLLDYLAYELVTHDYDLKHVARLILNSHAYQRVSRSHNGVTEKELALFAQPIRRMMRAEQLVDSMFQIAGKPFDAGPITLDTDGALPSKTALNLGEPTRAWQFASLSNERDRPSLAMPYAQPFVTFMETFGWRSARQDPLTVRERPTTMLQPAMLHNSLVTQRITRLSDDSALTAMALQDQSVDELIRGMFLRILSRSPDEHELAWFRDMLSPGYDARRRDAPVVTKPDLPRGFVSWSNHLSSRANEIKLELQRAVQAGDSPTQRLDPAWRARMEDAVWVLLNSPEFMFIP